jgi:hypothetical protein
MLMLHNGLRVAFSTSFESRYEAESMGRVGSTRPNISKCQDPLFTRPLCKIDIEKGVG